MKGVIKGINKFVSKKFVTTEKEPEIQIGNPTDVKHVAHIGVDGPSQNPPTWMTDFKGGGEETTTGNVLHGQGSARDLPNSSSRSTGMETGPKPERGKSRKPSRKVHRDSNSSKAIQISDEQSFRHKSSKEGSRKTQKKKSKDVKDASIVTDGSGKSRSSRSAANEGSSRGSTSLDFGSESESETKLSNEKYAKRNSKNTNEITL